MQKNEPSFRHENKYIISAAQAALLKTRIERIMTPDSHAGPDGIYTIRSLYFDDIHNRCLRENIDGTDPREKFRLRLYNGSTDFISLECKRKERGKTLKKSCRLTPLQAEALMQGTAMPLFHTAPPLMKKLLLQSQTALLKPKVIVEYERRPYVYKLGNVRVTFDMNISSSDALSDFLAPTVPRRPIMPRGQHLLEVKFDEFLPDYIYRVLNLDTLSLTTFSKYSLCRQQSLCFHLS